MIMHVLHWAQVIDIGTLAVAIDSPAIAAVQAVIVPHDSLLFNERTRVAEFAKKPYDY